MKRSAGITASAVIGIIGSIVSILFGGLMVLSAVMMRFNPIPSAPDQPVSPIAPALVLGVMSIFYFGFGVWGIVSAIGLLRLKNWARICFAIYGGILAFFSLCAGFGFLVAMLVVPQNTPQVDKETARLVTVTLGIFAIFALLCIALGLWWVIYFNRRRVKAQFLGEAAASAPRQMPLGISIVAWLLIVGGAGCGLLVFFSYPVFMFGLVLRGWAVHLVFLLYAVISLGTGIGLLKKRAEALMVAVGFYVFGALNGISYFLIPGSIERMVEISQEVSGTQRGPVDPTIFMRPALAFAVIACIPPLWLLLARRKAFIEACSKA